MTTRITLGALLLFLAISRPTAPLLAQQSSTDQAPAFRSGVELVTVEVSILDKDGVPIRGLGPRDFTVTVDGQPRRVVTADFIDTTAQLDAKASPDDAVPISTNEGTSVGRLVLFVVDSSSLDPGEMRRIANDASRLLSRLTFADRSALVSMPVGRNIAFTWAHDRVREALRRVSVTGGMNNIGWEYGSLSEARDIATRNPFALREVGLRECSSLSASSGFGGGSAPSPGPVQGQSSGPGETSQSGSGSGSGGSSRAPAGGTSSIGEPADDRCLREIQSQAEMAWNSARATSMSSMVALRNVLASLAQVPGDKTVVLISGGWPLDEHDETSLASTVAADAASARVKLFTIFAPPVTMSASLRRASVGMTRHDQQMYFWPLETLAGMTGGRSFRADAGAAGIFDRLARELSGFYRLGVEKNASDTSATGRPMKVKVARDGTTVRARDVFDVQTYEDRDWAARLATALQSPAPATALGLRVTSYLAADPDDAGSIRLLLTGEATRLRPGEAALQLVVRDLDGQRVVAGEQRLGDLPAGTAPFATNVRVPPGSYVVRLAIQDGAGRVGSVDHRVDVRTVPAGELRAVGPMLATTGHGGPRLALDGIPPDERLALEVDLQGKAAELARTDVTFEIAASAGGTPLVVSPASFADGGSSDTLVAQAVADVRVLPAGRYVARAKVRSGSEEVGELRRSFVILERGGTATMTAGSTAVVATTPSVSAELIGRAASVLPRFAISNVLAPEVLGAYLDRVGSRPDAAHPAATDLLGQARASGIAELQVSDAQVAQTPVAAFLKGLTLLAQKKYDPAAAAFRTAMRASPDFYPAMVYLGACYAAAGNDKEASAIWRTALIKEGSAPTVHLLLADALLRQGSGELALQVVDAARLRWPDDDRFKQKFVLASLLAGNVAGALQTLDDLVARGVSDEPTHALALLVLYDSLTHGRAIESADADRARMLRLADAYRARGGPSAALVDTWVEAVKKLR